MCKFLSLAWILLLGQLADFTANTSLACARYLNHQCPKWQRFLWFLVWYGGVTIAGVVVITLSQQFYTNPLITVFEKRPHGMPLTFPSIFICPDVIMNEKRLQQFVNNSALRTNDSILKKCIHNALQSQAVYNLSDTDCEEFTSSINNETSIQLAKLLKTPGDLFRNCHFAGLSLSSSVCFKTFRTECGYCFYFNNILLQGNRAGNKPLQDLQMHLIGEVQGHWGLSFNIETSVHDDIRIYILDSAEMPTLKTLPSYGWSHQSSSIIKFMVRERYTDANVQSLSLKQRNCLFADEWPLDKLLIAQYTYQPFYQESVCYYFCHATEIIKLCDCMPAYYTALFKRLNAPFCNLTQLNCLNDNMEAVRLTKCENCYKTCESNEYFITHVGTARQNFIQTVVHFDISLNAWPMLMQRTSIVFGWIELLLSFGGVLSLYLGLSQMDAIELFYFLTLNLICKFIRNKKALLEQARHKQGHVPMLNMSLRPNFKQ